MEDWYFDFANNVFRKKFSNKVLPKYFYDSDTREENETEDEYLDRLWEKYRIK